ncbi:MAG TPA: D-alanyl-D-alanine carboxypeptidase [Rhizobiales bacterium]|nr:D-alanyl-D-alanine carboxypeptidase [Hyphomicrobiales bacterium]
MTFCQPLGGVMRFTTGKQLFFLTFLLFSLIAAGIRPGRAFETSAKYAFLMDVDTQTVLFAKNENALMSPASMSKLMTMVMVFDALKVGQITMEEKFFISENAWEKGGEKSGSSTMFAKKNSQIRLKNLIPAVIVQSANDACIAIAEGLSGSEAEFAKAMTRRAREIGLEKSTFVNSTGWPDPGQKMTVSELAKLALFIIRNYPEYYRYFSMRSFSWSGITQRNRNPLLYQNMGADGLKTGHTQESGYGLVASAVRGGQRLILAINGLDSKRARSQESRRIMDWGFRAFRPYVLLDKGSIVGEASVWGGESTHVKLRTRGRITMLMPRTSQNAIKVAITYKSPLIAPVHKGDQVATLEATAPGAAPFRAPLYAVEDIRRSGLVGRGMARLKAFFSIF